MKLSKLFCVGAVAALSVASSQAQLTLNFGPTSGSTIQFDGTNSSFGFSPAAGQQWIVTSEVGGSSALNLLGSFNNGPFSYGPITTNDAVPGLDYQSAAVTGPLGQFSIEDTSGYLLTGNVNWIQVSTANYGGSIGINGSINVNVTSLSYSGSNPDLQTIANNGPGSMDVTFQFSPGETLGQLTSGTGPYNTSFSGSLSVVPEPGALSLLTAGGLLLGMWVIAKRRRAMLRVRA